MPFAVAGAAVAAGAGIAGSVMQSNTAAAGQKQAQQQFQQQRADLAPYREAGLPTLEAQNALLGLAGPDAANAAMAQFTQSPGYQWQLDQGLRAVDAGAAARGILNSGATLKAEQAYGSGLAAQEFGNYYNRLMALTNLGETAAAGGAQTANSAANAALGGANAQSSIYGNAASQLGGTANALLNNPSVQNWLGGSSGVSGNAVSGYTVPNNYAIGEGTGVYSGLATF